MQVPGDRANACPDHEAGRQPHSSSVKDLSLSGVIAGVVSVVAMVISILPSLIVGLAPNEPSKGLPGACLALHRNDGRKLIATRPALADPAVPLRYLARS